MSEPADVSVPEEQPVPTQPVPAPRPKVARKKPVDFPIPERRNWLIHKHFVRKEFEECKQIIKEQLIETSGECEYALYVQAMISRLEGKIAESTELFQAASKLNPKNPEILKQIAQNLFLLGKYKNAIECYRRAAEVSETKDWEISHELGVCFLLMKQYGLAEEKFVEALDISKHDITYSKLSRLYLEMNRTEKAVEILKKGVEFAPENLDLLTTLGLLYLRMKNFHASFELLGQAMTFDPENYKAILAAGSLMQEHGDYDVALSKYRIAVLKSESAVLWNNIAMCFFGKKKNVAAVSCLKRAAYLSPFDWKILYNLCLLHLVTQQYASAFQFGSTALRFKPKNPDILMLLGIALNNLGEVESAKKSYEEAYRLDPENAYVVVNFASFLYQNKETKTAQTILKKLEGTLREMESDPNKDKEIVGTAKKLGAALQLGERFLQPEVEEKAKEPTKSSKKHSSKKSPHGAETQSKKNVPSPVQSSAPLPDKPQSQVPLSLGSPTSSLSIPTLGTKLPDVNLPPLQAPSVLPAIETKRSKLPDVPKHEPSSTKTKKSKVLSSPQTS